MPARLVQVALRNRFPIHCLDDGRLRGSWQDLWASA